ncbi:MAG: hypothetical protein COT85_00050 [Chlamydiae bacterium CG10_big_fil_rev_8_21_14_0_10_42_34]|nr:MAG: hypothetical protein COT85_00050 [Chlamydiae bacterium CG10_big_fil_rev_8_21_14_0_10_42_34]
MIDCIVLAGGLGTRLKETVPDKPKPLAPIQGTPFLDLLLNQLPFASKIVLAVGYKASQIIDYYTNSPLPLDFSIETTPLGTGGAIKHALQKTTTNDLLVLNGDSFLNLSFEPFIKAHQNANADLTIASVHVENASRYGRLTLDSQTNKIVGFQEKSLNVEPGWINAGIYLMKRDLFENLDLGPTFSLEKEVFPHLLNKNVLSYPCSGTFIDIGTKESYLQAQQLLTAKVSI